MINIIKVITLWSLAFGLAILSAITALGGIAKNRSPELAIALLPTNGFALQSAATRRLKVSMVSNEGQFPNEIDSVTRDLALRAIIAEPTTSEAVGIFALSRPESVRRKLMQEAIRLSRRDSLTRGWMILDSAQANDLEGLLKYYDISLRTSVAAGDAMLPVMAQALGQEGFIGSFDRMLRSDPPWAGQFWTAVLSQPQSLANAVQLRILLDDEKLPRDSFRDHQLISQLVDSYDYESADRLYQILQKQIGQPAIVKDGDFSDKPEFPPVDWQTISEGEYGADISDGTLRLSAINNAGGLFARQLIRLPSGLLELKATRPDQGDSSAIVSINLVCAEKIANLPLPITIKLDFGDTTRKIRNFDSKCGYYWLNVLGRAGANGRGYDEEISSISINKL